MASSWSDAPPEEARALDVWPLDESNVKLLDAVRPRAWEGPTEAEAAGEYDIIAIGSGAGGLVTAKQAARRGARSALISGPQMHLGSNAATSAAVVVDPAAAHARVRAPSCRPERCYGPRRPVAADLLQGMPCRATSAFEVAVPSAQP